MHALTETLDAMPSWFWTFVAVAYGAVWGSFLNVVIYRVPRGLSVVHPRSACPQCKAPIAWHDNVPVLGWLLLRGKCRRCKNPISPRYPLVELLVAALSWALMQRFGPSGSYVVYFVFMWLLVGISFIDFDLFLIPDVLSYPGMVLGLLGALLLPDRPVTDHALGALIGGGVLWSVAVLAKAILKKDAMGLGDAKLLAMIGAFLGSMSILFVILLASLQGVVLGGLWLYLHRNDPPPPPQDDGFVPPPGAVPFGPFLALAALELLFFSEPLERLLQSLRFGE